LLDIETAPAKVLVWADTLYEQNVIEVIRPWYVLSFAYKWLDEKKIHCRALPDFPGYKNNKHCDKALMKELRELFDQADLIIAHNASFDIGKSQVRFLYHKLTRPSPFKHICTYQACKNIGRFSSKKLDNLAAFFGIGRKLPHQGKHTWLGCMKGNKQDWDVLKRYNKHDVYLLEGVYLRIRGWMAKHPALTWFTREHACPNCQSKNVQKRGFSYDLLTATGRRQRIQCQDCGAWSTVGKHIKEKSKAMP
jgi:RNase_H superfamily